MRRPDACGHLLAATAAELLDRAAAEVVRLGATQDLLCNCCIARLAVWLASGSSCRTAALDWMGQRVIAQLTQQTHSLTHVWLHDAHVLPQALTPHFRVVQQGPASRRAAVLQAAYRP